MDVDARWTGPLACLTPDDDVARMDAAGGALSFGEAVAAYYRTGDPAGLPDGLETVTLRPLSPAEAAACEAEAGAPDHYAGFVAERIQRAVRERAHGVSEDEARALGYADLGDREREAMHRSTLRARRLRDLRAARALVSASFAPPGVSPAEVVDRLPEQLRDAVLQEVSMHLTRIGALGIVGKAHAGQA
jgi:hypothetical protein